MGKSAASHPKIRNRAITSRLPWRLLLSLTTRLAPFLLILLGAGACAALSMDCSRPEVRCAGLVAGFGDVKEGGAHEAWLAMQDAKNEGMLDRVDYIETADTRDRAANIAALADQGYDIIVTVGSGISDETLAAARLHADLRFVRVQPARGASERPANLVDMVFEEENGGFLAGAVAALTSHTGRVAAVCEAAFIDSVNRFCEGFRAGARYVVPGIHVAVAYRSGSEELLFRDVAWGQAAARRQVSEGADVIFAVGARTAMAALTSAAGQGAWVIGAETDLYEQAPELRSQVVTSATLAIRSGLLGLLRKVANAQMPTGEQWGNAELAPWHEFEDRLDPGVLARIEEIQRDLESGALEIHVPLGAP